MWDTDRPASSVLVRRATRGAASGMVLLLHDGRGDERDPDISPMIEALPGIIAGLKARGFCVRTAGGRVKVGILCENYFPTLGGEQEHIFNLRRHLESPPDGSAPVDVRVIAPQPAYDTWHGPRDDEQVLRPARSIRVHGLGSASEATLTPRAYFALRRIFSRERFDLLHIHAPCDIGLPLWALWAFDGPIVGTLHSYFSHATIRTIAAPVYRYVMRRMTRVIAVSEAARDTIARYAHFECEIIANGIDCDAFAAGRPMPRFTDSTRNILSVARLEPRNGIDVIIEAFAMSRANARTSGCFSPATDRTAAEYEAQVARLPRCIGQRVVFLGAVWEERADLYASAHCYALAARKASFSILLLEALAAGLRIAALPAEGPASWHDNQWSLAEIARSQSPDAYADSLRRALVPSSPDDTERARAMAQALRWSRDRAAHPSRVRKCHRRSRSTEGAHCHRRRCEHRRPSEPELAASRSESRPPRGSLSCWLALPAVIFIGTVAAARRGSPLARLAP